MDTQPDELVDTFLYTAILFVVLLNLCGFYAARYALDTERLYAKPAPAAVYSPAPIQIWEDLIPTYYEASAGLATR